MNLGTGKYEKLLQRCADLDPVSTALAHPCGKSALPGLLEAARQGLITPILIGLAPKIESIAKSAKIDLLNAQIIDTPHSRASAAKAVELLLGLIEVPV